ncbi:MAG: hypothetical protein ACLFN8_03165 [Candidatus Woesearchaeota archaeon]
MMNKLKKMKRAELSINMIVIVALSILVLVIIVFILINRGDLLNKNTKCVSEGGVCVKEGACHVDGIIAIGDSSYCGNNNPICCNPMSRR